MIRIELQRVFITILSLSLSGALVGFILLLIHPLTERVLSKRWNYYIWLLLIVRLALPINFDWLGLDSIKLDMDLLNAENAMEIVTVSSEAAAINDETVSLGGAGVDYETASSESTAIDASEVPIEGGLDPNLPLLPSISDNVAKRLFTPINIIAAIWLAGVIIALSIKLCKYFYFINYVKNNSIPCTDKYINEVKRELSEMLKIGKVPMVYESDAVPTAITVGLFSPIIILSKEERAVSELKLILHHEYVHIIRKDLWYKWIYQILLCIHWFNPLLYLIDRRINVDCELSCDEAVLNYLSKEGMKIYGNLLLNHAQKNITYVKSGFSTTFMNEKDNLRNRLKGIIDYKKQSLPRVCVSICFLICMLFLSACGSVRFESGSMADGADAFLLREAKANKSGAAWKVYDDDNLIAGEDMYDQWSAFNYYGGGNKITASGFTFNGSLSERIIYAPDDIDISIDSEFILKDGKFKIVHIAPDGSVSTINESGEKAAQTFTMEKGRNVFKFVGQGAKIGELGVNFSGLDEKLFEKIYYSKDEECADQLIDELRAGKADKDELRTCMYLMEEADVSEAFKILLNRGVSFSREELCDIFIFSDAELSGRYLAEAIENGVISPLSVEELSEIIPYLDGEVKMDLIKSLPDYDFFDALEECAWYLNENELEQCLVDYLYAGGTMSYSEFKKISDYLDDAAMKRIYKYISEN